MNIYIIEMKNWIKLFYGDKHFLLIAACAYIYLLLFEKELRKKIVYPCILIAVLLLNPILYKIIYRAGRYWRFFWMLPNSMVIAISITKVIGRMNSLGKKLIVLFSFCFIIIMAGTNIYKNGNFTKIQNEYKLSADTIEVCNIILSDNSNPKCIMPESVFCEVRQYSADIKMLYGRDVVGYISDITEVQKKVFLAINDTEKDYGYILEKAGEEKCDYIVLENCEIEKDVLDKYGYIRYNDYNQYIIYKMIK